jgi:hypothetical protein
MNRTLKPIFMSLQAYYSQRMWITVDVILGHIKKNIFARAPQGGWGACRAGAVPGQKGLWRTLSLDLLCINKNPKRFDRAELQLLIHVFCITQLHGVFSVTHVAFCLC